MELRTALRDACDVRGAGNRCRVAALAEGWMGGDSHRKACSLTRPHDQAVVQYAMLSNYQRYATRARKSTLTTSGRRQRRGENTMLHLCLQPRTHSNHHVHEHLARE
jgi:hypothetical protein